ncbi:hypothetical protein ACQPZZ_30755 [Microbispora sp. CA-135349]|uniref:restriction system modified-DNA reader domain-containing protein n=1 Tax=Microbispora sp. CA-135349 TaxID=3239953 RepID=UPI003D92C549
MDREAQCVSGRGCPEGASHAGQALCRDHTERRAPATARRGRPGRDAGGREHARDRHRARVRRRSGVRARRGAQASDRQGTAPGRERLEWRRPRLGQVHSATVLPGGCLRLDSGEIFEKPSPACKAISGQETDGWAAWHRVSDGRSLKTLRELLLT